MREKSMVFWVGAILFCLGFTDLFETVWMIDTTTYPPSQEAFIKGVIPTIVRSIILIAIGIVMLVLEHRKASIDQKESETPDKMRTLSVFAFASLYFSFYLMPFVSELSKTEEGRWYLEMLQEEPLRAMLIAAVRVGRDPLLTATILHMGFYALLWGFLTGLAFIWLREKRKILLRFIRLALLQ